MKRISTEARMKNINRRIRNTGLAACVVGILVSTAPAYGQYKTRAEKTAAERQEKKESATPEVVSKTEARLNVVQDKKLLERFATGYHGLTVLLGGLATGQGFALGPQYLRTDLAGGNVHFRTSARYAFSEAYLADAVVALPGFGKGDRLFADIGATHFNYPRIDFFGIGPDTNEDDQTHFLIEKSVFEGSFGTHLTKNMRIGTTLGSVLVNTGPGNFEDVRARTEDVFSPAQVSGLVDQTNFVKGGVFAEFDYRDNPLGARSGGDYTAKFDYFNDTDLNVHDYRRLQLEAKQYFPFFNKRRVIALRARTIMSFTNGASSSVPFYMMDTLGGSEDLRGFRNYRFYDANQIIVNAEYRWESFTGLDMAVFFDAGKVAPKYSQINFHDLEASVGFGFRFNVKNATFIRIDTAFSHEGYTVWFKFANPF
jgi:hypothetical protein